MVDARLTGWDGGLTEVGGFGVEVVVEVEAVVGSGEVIEYCV